MDNNVKNSSLNMSRQQFLDPNKSMMSNQPIKQKRIFDDNVVLIKPTVDASDKEIYARNGYRTAAKNLVHFLESGSRAKFTDNVFKPKFLGDFTSNNNGIVKNVV